MNRKITASAYDTFQKRVYRFHMTFDRELRLPKGLGFVTGREYTSLPFDSPFEAHDARRQFEKDTRCYWCMLSSEVEESVEFDSTSFEIACASML
jgi:hypothetical protein